MTVTSARHGQRDNGRLHNECPVRTVSKSVLTMISILQLPGRDVVCSPSALTMLRGVDA